MHVSSPRLQPASPRVRYDLKSSGLTSPALKSMAARHGRFAADEESMPMLGTGSTRRRRTLEPYIYVLVTVVLASTAALVLSSAPRHALRRALQQHVKASSAPETWPASSFGDLPRPLRSQQPAVHLLDNLLRDGECASAAESTSLTAQTSRRSATAASRIRSSVSSTCCTSPVSLATSRSCLVWSRRTTFTTRRRYERPSSSTSTTTAARRASSSQSGPTSRRSTAKPSLITSGPFSLRHLFR